MPAKRSDMNGDSEQNVVQERSNRKSEAIAISSYE